MVEVKMESKSEENKERIEVEKNRIDFIKESVNYNIEIIQYLDQKTHLLIGTVGILIPLIMGLIGTVDPEKNPVFSSLGILLYIISIINLLITFGFCIHVIIAKSPDAPNTQFFGLDIIKNDKDKYMKIIKEFKLKDQIESYSTQSYTLGEIMEKKFQSYNFGIYFLISGIILLLASFFLLVLETL